ncbi:MAG: hypothetical protein CL479_06995 [Acidobacteria bacterium]|nr:hypothetical protein [Acidobacteriota bacterium]|tara:strand:+ start:111 stop:530 length:420 start_codon:yes stop_codon:yes gene_type:complete
MLGNPRTVKLTCWLWLFCGLLGFAGPIGLMLEASRLIGGLAYGDLVTGTALAVRVIFCGLGVAAALALIRRHRIGIVLARASLAASVVFALARASLPFIPSNLAPSDEWVRFCLTTLHAVGWWTYFATSDRVRQIYGTN